jgi:AbrB family looped-hinge helix DNA binding protein
MAVTTKLSETFELSIPKEVREALDWKAGQEFAFIPHGKGALVIPAPSLDEIRGIANQANPTNYRDRRSRY